MQLRKRQSDHAYLLQRAGQVLGRPVRALALEWDVERRLVRRLRVTGRRGVEGKQALLRVTSDKKEVDLAAGIEAYQIRHMQPPIRLVKVDASWNATCGDPLYEFWAVGQDDYPRLVAYLRTLSRRARRQRPPVMHVPDRRRLWSNTIGFLKTKAQALRKYGVPQRRGVLLVGAPGGGKTMACRWLRHECRRRKLAWKTVSAADYHEASPGHRRQFFELPAPGIILFDDLDLYVRDRERSAVTADSTTFLTELDGVETRRSLVYLFTTNARLSDLDEAFLRPGRIDQVIEFPRPCALLRERLVHEFWHEEIRAAIDVDCMVSLTAGLSFAELDEVKKLLVLHFLDQHVWSWEAAWAAFQTRRLNEPRQRIGFLQPARSAPVTSAAAISADGAISR
jgi:hypothetical protein